MELEAEDFLELIWGEDNGGWVDLPAKVNGYWIPYPLEWPPHEDITISRRIDQSLRDGEDLYFSVARFSERGRALEDVLPVAWLWADLDAVHPSTAAQMGLMPSIAVESSPGRYQAYWRLAREVKPKVVEKLNRALTYALGADKGGWDLTQVLRIPGTRNHKYPGAPRVRLLWYEEGLVYKARYVMDIVRQHITPEELKGVAALTVTLPRKDIPRKAKQLLWAKAEEVVEGERSDRLWELNCLLAESGLTEDEIYQHVVHSVWNKWADQRSGRDRLRLDIRKAMTHVRRKAVSLEQKGKRTTREVDSAKSGAGALDRGGDLRSGAVASGGDDDAAGDEGDGPERDGDIPDFSPVRCATFVAMPMEEPKWLIEDIWAAGSHGIIGGEPKTSKTTLAMAMGLSVASGKPFLGEFKVGVQGPVLMIQEENAASMMQARMKSLLSSMGLISTRDGQVKRAGPGGLNKTIVSVDMVDIVDDIPFEIMNRERFFLYEESHQEWLQNYMTEVRPALVIIDPLNLTFGPIEVNSMGQLQPFFSLIIGICTEHNCALAVVHHMGKQNQNTIGRRAGQRLIGSATLHGFTDSALYTTRVDDAPEGWTKVRVEREFRAAADKKPFEMAWQFGEGFDVTIQLDENQQKAKAPVSANGILGRRKQSTLARLAKERGESRAKVKRLVEADDLLGIRQMGPGRSPIVYRINPNGN